MSRLKNFSRYLEELVQHSSDIFWIRNSDYSKQLYVSPAYEKIWGLPAAHLYEFPGSWINSIFPEDRERLEKDFAKRNPLVLPGQMFSQSYRIIRPDGKICWIEDESFAIFDSAGKHIGFAGIAKDITEKVNRELSLTKATEEANAANNAKTEFIENMSHDVKTPISGVIGMAELLTMELTNPTLKEYAEDIKQSGQQLLDFFNDILSILNEDTIEKPKESKFNLENLAKEVVAFVKPSLSEKNIHFQFHCPPKIGRFFGNRFNLNRILLNLISNAIKFTDTGGKISLTITRLKKIKDQQTIEIAVSDTGIGIPKESQKIIFDRYTRLSPSYKGKYKGTGLGLYIVKKLLDEMGGSITVESEFGKGSTFRFTIPLKILNAEVDNTSKVHTPQVTPNKPLMSSTIKVLLVEDNLTAQKVAENLLLEAGCSVDIATTGHEAIEKFRNNDYNLIVMDIGLPDMSGNEVTEEIRKYEKTTKKTDIPILGITAHIQEQAFKKGLASGMNDLMSKPLTADSLNQILNKFFNIKLTAQPQTLIVNTESDVIDLELGAKILNSTVDAAKQMIATLVNMLPGDLQKVQMAFEKKDYKTLKDLAHYIKGGASYCGTPRLKKAAHDLDQAIKAETDSTKIEIAYKRLCDEINSVISAYNAIR